MSGDTLVDVLDRLLEVGVVLQGDALLTVADVPLVHLDLKLVLRGIEGRFPGDGALPASDVPDEVRTAVGGSRAPSLPARSAVPDRADVAETRSGQPSAGDAGSPDDPLPQPAGTADVSGVQRGLAGLVLALVDTLREVLERQAIRRMEADSLDEAEVERLGTAFAELRAAVEQLADVFGIDADDLAIDLGDLRDVIGLDGSA